MNYTMSDVVTFVAENDVKFIRLAFCDLLGNLRNISIMPVSLEKAFDEGIAIDGDKVTGFSLEKNEKLYLYPDPNTIKVLPWRPQTGRVVRFFCSIKNSDGSDFMLDIRTILQDELKKVKDMGYSVEIATKSEFYLFKTDEDGNPTDIPFDEGGYLDVSPNDRGENVRREICLCLEDMGLNPESSHHEVGPGQNEIDFKYDDALSAGDNFLTFKSVVKAIAARNGLYASFMPRPLKDEAGSGLIISISIYKNGENIFSKDFIDHERTSKYFINGIIKYSNSSTAVYNPLINSYERIGKKLAPLYSFSGTDTLFSIRPTFDNSDNSKIEFSQTDCSVNPYMALFLIIKSGFSGIDEKISEIEKERIFESLDSAILKFRESEFINSIFPKQLIENYIRLKQKELTEVKKYDDWEDYYYNKYFRYI